MSNSGSIVVRTDSPGQTRELAARLGQRLKPGDFVALIGPLGSGKTCFVQGLATGLRVEGNVTSPTFIIMRYHPGQPALCHADAYRIGGADELEDIGISDFLDSAVVAVEWAERVRELWPAEVITVQIDQTNDPRVITISGRGKRWQQIRAELEQ